ncbi:hypothetical protein PYCC9005_002844 [Savitreella phatthalungensis]
MPSLKRRREASEARSDSSVSVVDLSSGSSSTPSVSNGKSTQTPRTTSNVNANAIASKRRVSAISIESGNRSPERTHARPRKGVVDLDALPDAISIGSDESDDEDVEVTGGDDGLVELELVGCFEGKVVGIRYYAGRVSQDEYVALRREHTNRYDRNAIQVLSVRGEQVGHLPADHARALTPWVDGGVIRLEAACLGKGGVFALPLIVSVYADPANVADLREELNKAGIWLRTREHVIEGAASRRRKRPVSVIDLDQIAASSTQVESRSAAEVIDDMVISEKDLEAMPLAPQPARLATKLLPFQLAGLRWMQDKENPRLPTSTKDHVQMWKKQRDEYANVVTQFQTSSPRLARGGMLCDDMGLGKTLQTIALIASDDQDGSAQKSPTLVVCPTTLLSQWQAQVEQHVAGHVKLCIYHGTNKPTKAELQRNEIVLTTYGMVANDCKRAEDGDSDATLFNLTWRRIVLDEAHGIRNPKAQRSAAVAALKGDRRWCLTGTSVVNTYNDLAAYVRFVGWDGGLSEPNVFAARITRSMGSTDPQVRENALQLLRMIMADLTLRRRKNMSYHGKPLLDLPELKEFHYRIDFEFEEEQQTYHRLADQALAVLHRSEDAPPSAAPEPSVGTRGRGKMLELLLRMRQAACSTQLISPERLELLEKLDAYGDVVPLTDETRDALQHLLSLRLESQDECPICMDPLASKTPVISHCKHAFCRPCIAESLALKQECPLCRSSLKTAQLLELPKVKPEKHEESEDSDGEARSKPVRSSKIKGLMRLLEATAQNDPTVKTVVFSQWTSFLDLIEQELDANGFTFTRIDGSQSVRMRDLAVRRFGEDSTCSVLLASLGVASVGLNLVMASQVILTDPWWAPAIEDQALDRLYRMGQRRTVTAYKLYVANTVEEKVLEIQQRKRQLVAKLGGKRESRKEAAEARRHDIEALLSAAVSAQSNRTAVAADPADSTTTDESQQES